jgi:hypothetical protein
VLVLWLKTLQQNLAQVSTLPVKISTSFLIEVLSQEGAATINKVYMVLRAVLGLIGSVAVLVIMPFQFTSDCLEGQ